MEKTRLLIFHFDSTCSSSKHCKNLLWIHDKIWLFNSLFNYEYKIDSYFRRFKGFQCLWTGVNVEADFLWVEVFVDQEVDDDWKLVCDELLAVIFERGQKVAKGIKNWLNLMTVSWRISWGAWVVKGLICWLTWQ